jgi:hypothetical protein
MRRLIDLDVQGPPQGDPHRRAFWRHSLPVEGRPFHFAVFAGALILQIPPSGSRIVISLVPQWVSSNGVTTSTSARYASAVPLLTLKVSLAQVSNA